MSSADLVDRAAKAAGYDWKLGGWKGISLPVEIVETLLARIARLEGDTVRCPKCDHEYLLGQGRSGDG